MEKIKNSSYYIKKTEGFSDISKDILAKPIGVVRKNHKLIAETLKRNIGNGKHGYDGFGTAISDNSQPSMNGNITPWFKLDDNKKSYANYIDYINNVYGLGIYFRFPNNSNELMKLDENIDYKNGNVGVIRGYDFTNSNMVLNPNDLDNDSHLGMVNNHYLSTTLLNSYKYYEKHDKNGITTNVYHNFEKDGRFGITSKIAASPNGRVLDNVEIHNGATGIMPRFYHNYIDYGTYADSEALMINTDKLTRDFIVKSLLGIDLSKRDILVNIDSLNMDFSNLSSKKYYPSKNGFDYLTNALGSGFVYKTNRELYNNYTHNNSPSMGELSVYNEAGGNYNEFDSSENFNGGINYGVHRNFIIDENRNDIVRYTNEMFAKGEYKTIMARFHTDKSDDIFNQTSSAVSNYGMSRGRNLLKKDHRGKDVHGYSDPYCRVWTFHKQYSKLDSLIRPFDSTNREALNTNLSNSTQVNRKHLLENGVRQSNGLVQIAPTKEDNIKKCMFSIENLAWKHEDSLMKGYEDQRGPLGGRIMWFPPYSLNFSENVSVNWSSNNFIGRGEPIYTYSNTERSGNLSFKLLIDHPSLINKYKKGLDEPSDVDNTESSEQMLLRFFAGCEVLEGVGHLKKRNDFEEIPVYIPNEIRDEKEVVFYVFFPNNYSGVDDDVTGDVRPMQYLANGFGASLVGSGGVSVNLPTDYIDHGAYGGYEMGDYGISCVQKFELPKSLNEPFLVLDKQPLMTQNGEFRMANSKITCSQWAYRVDKAYVNQIMNTLDNYADTVSYQLNSSGYTKLLEYHKDAETYQENGNLYSFNDVFAALDSNYINKFSISNNGRPEELRKIFQDYEIVKVTCEGYASSAGRKNWNDDLGKNRADSVYKWLQSLCPNISAKYEYKTNQIGKVSSKSINDLEHKVYRCTKVVINLTSERVTDLYENQTLSENQINYLNKLLTTYSDTDEAKMLNGVDVNPFVYSELTKTQKIALNSLINKANEDDNFLKEEAEKQGKIDDCNHNFDTYGKEYEFFNEIASDDTFLHHRIKDKIKYFDPAYHSISPEGFNARLNFLHQCTRQGSTTVNNNSTTANNLSFGAPPVCVLRLGDFYNTKIIIDSLQISYDDTTWDLNDEGIGVMPMMADITIGFKFLGGNDLSGPVSRLQNAVSFNYYANTKVYDDRAETPFKNENK